VITKDPAKHNTAPADHIEGEGLGRTLFPQSLYQDQLARRLGSGIAVPSIGPRSTVDCVDPPSKQ
jgi:hypothetical protein